MSEGTDQGGGGSGWWKPVAVVVGAVVAVVVAWGWVKPAPETPLEVADSDRTEPVAVEMELERASRQPPAWVKPTVLWTIGIVVAVVAAAYLLGALRQVVVWLVLALFFSFALEPGVNRLARRGWRRGSATGFLLAVTFLLLMTVGLIFVVTLVRGATAIVSNKPAATRPKRMSLPAGRG